MNQLFFASFVLIFSTNGFTQKYENSLLWEISGNGISKPSYLFGTIHSSMEEFFNLSDSVFIAIESAESFAGELNMDSLQLYILKMANKSRDYSDISEVLTRDEYKQLDKKIEEKLGLKIEDLPSKDPVLISMALEKEYFKGNMPYFLDEYLHKIAKLRGKNITGVETFEDQFDILDSLNSVDQRELLLSTLEEDDKKLNLIEILSNIYLQQDLNKLEELFHLKDEDNLDKQLIDKRNLNMANKIDYYAKDKSIFVAVGAAHLVGKKGLIKLLREKGYSLRAVQTTNTGLSSNYKKEILGQPWVVYLPPSGGFSVEMPGDAHPVPVPNQTPGVKFESGFYVELGTEINYMAFKIIYPLTLETNRKDSVYNSLIKNLSSDKNKLDEEVKDIMHDGLSGKEIRLTVNEFKSLSRVFIKGNNLFWLQVVFPKNKKENENVDRFFNSFKLLAEKTTNLDNKFISEKGAFKIKFDNEPLYQLINENDYFINVFTASDKTNEAANFVMYVDNIAPAYYNDSSFLQIKVKDIASVRNGKFISSKKIENDFPCLEFKLLLENGFYSGRVILRGGRFYVIASSCYLENYDSIKTESFLNSLEFTDYLPLVFSEYKNSGNDFIVNLPQTPVIEYDSSEYDVKYTETYSSVDSSSGIAYYIYKYTLSEFYQAANDSSLFSIFFPRYSDSNEVFIEKDTLLNNLRIIERVIKPENRHNYTRNKLILNGSSVYQFEVSAPGNLIYSERVEPFFDSIKIFETNNNNIYSDKSDIFFESLQSSDSITSQYAASYCYSFNFNEGHLEKIYDILEKKFPDDERENSVRGSLLYSLRFVEANSKLDFIQKLYLDLSAYPLLQKQALAVMSNIKTKESSESFLNLILSNTPHTDDNIYYLFTPFYDSLENLSILFPNILKLIKDEEYKEDIYSLLCHGIDSMVIQPHQYLDYENIFIDDAKNLFAKRDSLIENDEEYNYTWKIINIISTFSAFKNNPEIKEILRLLANDSIMDVSLSATISLLKMNDKVSPDIIYKIAADKKLRDDLYNKLSDISKTDLFPSEYYLQKYFAESDLYSWIYEDDYSEPDTLIQIDSRKNEEGIFYLYKFTFNLEDDENYYIGISGPQPLDESTIFVKGNKTKTLYSLMEEKSIEEHWNALLKEENYE